MSSLSLVLLILVVAVRGQCPAITYTPDTNGPQSAASVSCCSSVVADTQSVTLSAVQYFTTDTSNAFDGFPACALCATIVSVGPMSDPSGGIQFLQNYLP